MNITAAMTTIPLEIIFFIFGRLPSFLPSFQLHSIREVEGSRSKSLDQASHNRACCRRKISGKSVRYA